MADMFKFIGGLPSERKEKVYNIAGKTKDEAMKYLRYLNRNAMFGTHTGLPQEIRNSKINESLISNIGDYSVLDVFSTSGNSCQIGTVVNFYTSDPNNTLGATYVYPCIDKNKPMGYMISKAEPDKLGVCLVHGVLEVPLAYPKGSEELERGNYVEYDIEDACFRFAESGYPVFNVYQDVDGDWIAIILFGDISSDYSYDGPFAVSVAGITGSTMYVNSLGGSVLYNDVNGECADLEISVPLSTGESLWLETAIVGDTHSYQFLPLSIVPIDGSTIFYTKLAENNEGKLRQVHYGNIRYSRTKIISGSTNVHIYPSNGLGDVVISVDSTTIPPDRFFVPDYDSLQIIADTIPDGLGHTFILPVKAGTVCMWDEGGGAKAVYTDIDGAISITLNNKEAATVPYDGWVRVSVIDGGTASNECLSLDTSTGHIELYKYGTFGGKNIEYKEGIGISITDETISVTNEEVEGEIVPVEVLTGNKIISLDADLTATLENDVVSISITGSTSPVKLIKGSGITFTDGSSENEIIIGATFTQTVQDLTLDVDDDTATIGLTESSSQVSITGGTNISIIAGDDGEFVINCTVVGNTGSVTGITSSVGVNDATVSLIGGSGSVVFVGEGLTTISTNENDEIVIGSTFTETPQDLSSFVGDTGTATVSLSGSTNTIKIIQGDNITITAGEGYNEIILGSTVTGTVTGLTSSVNTNSATVSTIGGSGKVNFVGVGGTTVGQGITDTVLIDSIVYKEGTGISIDDEIASDTNLLTGDKIISLDADLSSSLTNPNEASVYITGSTAPVKFKAGEGIVVSAGQNLNEVVISSVITIDVDGSGGGGSGGLDTLSVSIMDGTASIYITGTTEYVKLIKGSGVTITEGASSNEVIIGSTVSGNTGTVTGVSYSVGLDNTATISTIGGSGKVRFVGDGVDITETSSNEIKLSVTGGTSGGGSYNNQYIYTQPNEASAVSVDDAVINISPNTRVFFAVYHNLREISGTKYYRYYWTGDEPSGQYKRTRHLTNYSNPDYDGGSGYGSEIHLTAPSENCSVIIDVFYESTCIVSAEHTIILQSGLRIEPTDFVPLYENNTYVFTFVSGATSFWYAHGIG